MTFFLAQTIQEKIIKRCDNIIDMTDTPIPLQTSKLEFMISNDL